MNILNVREYIETFLKIRTKDGTLMPLRLNQPQDRMYQAVKSQWDAGKPVRIIVLKARQMGFSTLTEAIIFAITATRFYTDCMIVAHKDEATANLFRMSLRYYENLPEPMKPMRKASNAHELVFDKPAHYKGRRPGLGSSIKCATAGGSGVGRSATLRCLHLSEFAFWPGDKRETLAGLSQAVPDKPGTMIIIESTANGYDEFKNRWDAAVEAQRRGEDGYLPIFFAWYEMEEYRRTPPPGFERTPEEQEPSIWTTSSWPGGGGASPLTAAETWICFIRSTRPHRTRRLFPPAAASSTRRRSCCGGSRCGSSPGNGASSVPGKTQLEKSSAGIGYGTQEALSAS